MSTRNQRRAVRKVAGVKDPAGNWLYPKLMHVIERDDLGRPTLCRVAYDEETVQDVVGGDEKPVMVMVWMHDYKPS